MIDFIKSFAFAFFGIGDALVSERNFRILWLCGLLIILVNFFIKFSVSVQIIFLLLIFIILAFELINSALEKSLDSLHNGHSLLIKKAKDFCAGAVLLIAFAAFLIVGIIIHDNFIIIYEKLKTQTLFFVGLACIALFNFFLCLEPNYKRLTLILSLAALLIHLALVINYSGSLFYLILSLLFHACLLSAYNLRKLL